MRVSVALLLGLLLAASGCSVESSLKDVTCEEENAVEGDRVCQDGYWVDRNDVITDAGDGTEDVEPDSVEDTETDIEPDTSPECMAEETLCDGSCVDTSSSSQHCGGCGQTCESIGNNTLAECTGGFCHRYCEPGFVDGNGDWIEDVPSSDSNGCEAECTESEGGDEICDNEDNDCDGRVDEAGEQWYRDNDGDGFGDDDSLIEQCDRPSPSFVKTGGDCNDSDPNINPGIVEECTPSGDCTYCNGRNDNCNNTTDENCPCNESDQQDCYTFNSGNPGDGPCRYGTQTCDNGQWGACEGDSGPDEEICNGEDDDCDGTPDNDVVDAGSTCTTGREGICSSGTEVCMSGALQCSSDNAPTNEICNGLDDDCDGTPDNNLTDATGESCDTGQDGICGPGTNECVGGSIVCQANNSPTAETCNGEDDDCNGAVDDGVKTTYYKDVDDDDFGITGDTQEACSPSGDYTAVQGTDCADDNPDINPGEGEVCDNGLDDNCDGVFNEACPCDFGGDNIGVCANSTRDQNGDCQQPADYVADEGVNGDGCGDSLDNDCDTGVDEGCSTGPETNCMDGMDNDGDNLIDCEDDDCDMRACGTGTGAVCDFNQTECVENLCDGVDNDEDTDVDEECDDDEDGYCNETFTIDTDDACANTVPGDRSTYDCNDGDDNIHPGATEECDGVDSDCDRTADEDDQDAEDRCKQVGGINDTCRLISSSYCCKPSTAGGC